MAEYRPFLIRAISRLDANTPDARQSVYASARTAFVALMRPQDASQTSMEKFEREYRALEDAIATVESSMLDVEETPTSSVSSEKGKRSYSPTSVPTDQTQPFEGRANSSTISGITLHTSAFSNANYYRAWQLLRQSFQSLRVR